MATLQLKKNSVPNSDSSLQTAEDKVSDERLKAILNAAKKLETRRTPEEFLSLIEALEYEDVPVLELSNFLRELQQLLGGLEQFHHILPLYKKLMDAEDEQLRSFAEEHLKSAFNKLNSHHITQHIVPFLNETSKDSWSTTRALACTLYTVCYQKVTELQKELLLSNFLDLCQDEDVDVRLIAVKELGDFSKKLDFKRINSIVIPVFIKLTEDIQDSVRILTVDAFFGVSAKLIPRNVEQLLMPAMRKLFTDKSVKVRCKLAERISKLQKSVGAGLTKSDLIPAFINFLKDSKAEVKSMALHSIVEFCNNLDPSIRETFVINDALPQLKDLICDTCQHVRLKSTLIPRLAQYLEPEVVKSHLLPLVSNLIGNEFPKVFRSTIYNLDSLKKMFGSRQLSEILICDLEKLVKHQKLARRLNFMENLPLLAEKLGPEFFNSELTSLCISGAVSNSNVLQESALRNLAVVFKTLGDDWVKTVAFPEMQQALDDNQDASLIEYSLNLIEMLLRVCDAAEMSEELASMIFRFTANKANSVRNHAVRLLRNLVSNLNGTYSQHDHALNKIKAHLELCTNDSDQDIKNMAAKTLEAFFSAKNSLVEMHRENHE